MENTFSHSSGLISGDLEGQLKTILENLRRPVTLTCIADEGSKSQELGAFLNHFAALCPMLSCRFLSPGEDPALDEVMDARLLPAAGIGPEGERPRMIFHGIPGGKEITSFLSGVLAAGGAAKELDKYTMKDIQKIRRPMELQVCVSLACHHCAQLAASAMRIAWENPQVTAHTIDANLYPELVQKYSIERVPLLIIDREKLYPGGKTMAELTGLLSKMK